MAALYQKDSYPGKDLVLEMYYTDVNECYQILLGKEGSKVYTDHSLTATTRIETPVTLWRSIAAGEIRGDEAMMQQLYKVKGDFSFMLNWDNYFGSAAPQKDTAACADASPERETNMSILLIPWIALCALDRLSCFDTHQLHDGSGRFPESAPAPLLYGYSNPPFGVSGSFGLILRQLTDLFVANRRKNISPIIEKVMKSS